jgi:DnaJ-class molecular chaperone
MNKDQATKEAKALNAFKRKTMQRCGVCNGTGYQWAPLHGDANLGYVRTDKCHNCNGKGKENVTT